MNHKNSPKQYDAILMDKTKVKLLMFIKKKDKYKGKTWSRCINLRLALSDFVEKNTHKISSPEVSPTLDIHAAYCTWLVIYLQPIDFLRSADL